MGRKFLKKVGISLFIIMSVLILTFVPDNSFSAEHEDVRISIRDFKIIGNEAIDDETILGAISSYRNNDYTLEELKYIADVVTMLYQEEGYMLAKAYVSVQDIKDGIVEVVVVEGDMGSVEISYSKYYSQGYVYNFFSHLIGKAVKESEIERAIFLANETPSMRIHTVFEKGEMPGTTDLKVKIEDTYPIFLDFKYNNYGNKNVSKNRYTASFSMTDPIIGSTLSLKGMVGEQRDDSSYGAIDLCIPLNYDGTKLGMRYVNADYVVGNDFQSLGIEGDARIFGVYLSHAFKHSRNHKLKGIVGFDMKRVFSYALGTQISNDDLSVGYLRLDYDSRDRFLGENHLSINYSVGFEDLFGSLKLNDSNTSRYGADGRFNKLNADYVRIQRLWGKLLLLVKTSGQYASQRLVSTEQYSIGGAYSVRGKKLATHMGDHGYQLSAEFSTPLPFVNKVNIKGRKVSDMIRVVAFVDHGGVFISKPVTGEDESKYATGIGVGVRFYLFDRVNIKLDVGWPYRDNSVDIKENIFYAQATAKVIKF